jgi:leader peptidase (prepilin peptidase) / N-methyltransferase
MKNSISSSFESVVGIPEVVGYVFVFVLGACIGSFLNVVIYRLPNAKSLLTGSACPNCKEPIRFYHNIPVIGWLMLAGKCGNCRQSIAWRYPAVELLTALVYITALWQVGFTPLLPVALVFISSMIALIFIDAEHMILPNKITYLLLVFAIAIRIVYPVVFSENYFPDIFTVPTISLIGYPLWVVNLAAALFGALVGGGFLWLVGAVWKLLRGVDAMGLGDVKMMLGVGAFLGWRLTMLTIFLGAFTGALAGVLVLSRQKDKNFQTQIPFGIFLGIGSVIALLFGDRMIAWYLERFVN